VLSSRRAFWGNALSVSVAGLVAACGQGLRAAVDLNFRRSKATPRDASVIIDEEYIGPLSYVAAHGIRLPVGEHRISVTKPGFFPWDQIVVADRYPIFLDVKLDPVPD